MIDLISTRPGISPDQAACARLFSAIIARAVLDAVCDPNGAEKAGKATRRTIDRHAMSALEFLFEPSAFEHYADLAGLDARDLRRGLIAGNFVRGPHSPLNETHARILRLRLRLSGIDYREGA
jgi:hypothetical protein